MARNGQNLWCGIDKCRYCRMAAFDSNAMLQSFNGHLQIQELKLESKMQKEKGRTLVEEWPRSGLVFAG